MSELKPCPCGKIPKSLSVYELPDSTKYGLINPSCCSHWLVEFRRDYLPADSEECKKRMIDAWNNSSRKEECSSISHTLAGFLGGFYGSSSSPPTQQEVWNAAIRSYKDLCKTQNAKQVNDLASLADADIVKAIKNAGLIDKCVALAHYFSSINEYAPKIEARNFLREIGKILNARQR